MWPDVPRTFFLHVATENEGAIEMYRHHGFRRIQLLPGYYDYGTKADGLPDFHDAFLYVKDVTPASLAGEMLASLWDCIACTLTVAQKSFSLVVVPAKFVFRFVAKSIFPMPEPKIITNVTTQPAKIV